MQDKKQRIMIVVVTLAALAGSLAVKRVQAQVCAMCMVAIGSGLGISRWLGVDDIITGVWLGAAVLALASFASNWVAKKWPQLPAGKGASFALIVIACLVGVYFADGYVASTAGTYRLSNLAVGMIIGAIALLLGQYTDKALRVLKDDGGKPYFPFQKVVVPVVVILLGTLAAWFLIS